VLDRRQVACYDPTLASGADLGKKLKAVFEATRKKFLEDVASVAATNRTVRMRRLERMSVLHRANPAMASHLLEQIAKEMVPGGHRRLRQHTPARPSVLELSPEPKVLFGR
jgi:hypothetical protein